jgi:RNA polymerase sigma-70 factor (ECF subfamily)
LPTNPPVQASREKEDEELVERAVHGDLSAFDDLIRRHGPAVFRAARALLISSTDAEDVMQEALLLAYRKLAYFRGESTFKTWLLKITWRCALRSRGTIARRLRRLVSSDISSDFPSTERSAEAALLTGELSDALWRMIRTLPERLRDPLLLTASGQYTYEELSDILDLPTGTLKWRVSEARRILRDKLQRLGYPIRPDLQ